MLLRVGCGVVVAALRAQATELQASATEAQDKSERLEAELATLRQAAEAAGEEQGGALAKLVRISNLTRIVVNLEEPLCLRLRSADSVCG
eukprot:COSAG04_NODE_21735_length_368_cov_1.159851_1_plen_89_part_01